ncbi:MAG: phage tail protein [Uliginosibacterium sp.]|nr:phage tail protein [Uliginosibacterium sp.]
MATLPTKFKPEYGAQEQTIQNVLRTKFGDGYEQRSANGINSTQRVWPPDIQILPCRNDRACHIS